MYENFKLCDTLQPSEICYVVEQYEQGPMVRRFHRHIPKSRTNRDTRIELLRALVMHFEGYGPNEIIRCYVNSRPGDPIRDQSLKIVVSYPEEGVIRHYCGTDTVAWFDQVIAPKQFRRSVTDVA